MRLRDCPGGGRRGIRRERESQRGATEKRLESIDKDLCMWWGEDFCRVSVGSGYLAGLNWVRMGRNASRGEQ